MDNWTLSVLGGGSVGKTALIIQLTSNYFFENFDPTIEDDYQTLLVVDNRMCLVDMIDTAGGEEYAALREQWIRKSKALILVYSVTSRSSFEYLEDIYRSIQRLQKDNPIIMLVGNKCDKTQEREVSKADGAALARQFGCGFIETSAKTTQNVERLFINLVRSLREKITKQEPLQSVRDSEREPCKCVIF